MVQPLQLMVACSSFSIAGSAVATMVWSTEAINSPMDTIAKISLRRSFGAPRSGPACWLFFATSPATLTGVKINCLLASIQADLGECDGHRTRGPAARGHPPARPRAQRHVHRRGPHSDAVLRAFPGPRPG